MLRENLASEREQIAFLRLQIEASNRANAEISAALREALKMGHRALNEGAPSGSELEEDRRDVPENWCKFQTD